MGLRGRLFGYGMSRSLVEALLAARAFALASILGPEVFGTWALFQVGMRYCAFAGLGLLRGLEVEVASDGARWPQPSARQRFWGEVVAGYSLILYLPLAALAALGWLWWSDAAASLALLGIALALPVDRLWGYALTFLRAAGTLKRFAALELAHATLQLILTAALALVWGLVGAYLGFALASLAGVVLVAGRAPLRPRRALRSVRRLLRIGFPVSLTGILTASLATADRLLVGALGGLAALGVYAFAVALSGFGVSCALVVRNVILTDVYRKDPAAKQEAPPGAVLLESSIAVLAVLVPPIAALAALCLGPAVMRLLPQYEAAVPVAQILIFTGIIQGLVNVTVLGVVAAGRQRRLPWFTVSAVGMNVGLSALALQLGLGLVGVAVAALVTRALYAAGVLKLRAGTPRPEAVTLRTFELAIKPLLPTLWCVAVVLSIDQLLAPREPIKTLAALLACTGALLPLLPLIRRTLAALRALG
jgi:O-antigen/teichoic acid export membrane protein